MFFEGHVYSLGDRQVRVYMLPLLDVTPNTVLKNVVVIGYLQKSPNFQDLASSKGVPPGYEIFSPGMRNLTQGYRCDHKVGPYDRCKWSN